MRTLSIATILFTLAGCAGPSKVDPAEFDCEMPADDGSSRHPRRALFARLLDELRDDQTAGAVLGLHDRDGTWFGAVGSAAMETKTPMKPCHRTRVMSISKTFTAATILRLAEEKKLSLDDTLKQWLPADLAKTIVHADTITVRDLLRHTSGLSDDLDTLAADFDWANAPYRRYSVAECERFMALVDKDQVPPGTRFVYSNRGYDLLGLYVVQKAAGGSLNDAMAREIFEPLRLTSTSAGAAANSPWTGAVPSYGQFLGDRTYLRMDDFLANNFQCRGAGDAVISNVYDLVTFADALLRQKSLLSAASLDAMMPAQHAYTPATTPPSNGYGLGLTVWQSAQGPLIGHSGGWPDQNAAFMFYLPESETTLVLWYNDEPRDRFVSVMRIIDALAGKYP